MPDAGYFGLTYELLFEGDSAWTDITALVDSRTTKIDIAGCSEELKSVISKCTFEMRYNTNPSKTVHSELVGKILSAKQAGKTVKFRMGGIASFVGKVDLGSFSQRNGRIPGFLTVTVEDNSYLLDEVMASSFEYPATNDLDDEGWAVFDKANLAESIVMLRFLDAGYTVDQIDLTTSDSITEKVRRVVYDADDERTYREMLDTLLFEHCAVIYTTPEGKLSVRRLYRESPVSERSVEEFLVGDGIETGGGDYSYDGVKVVWSNLSKLDGAVVYNANITMKLDDEGNREGEEIQPHHYWPEDGDIEETWQEFNATFLDREYQTKVSRTKNKDLSLISVKNAYYEVDKDAEILLANNPPEIEPTKARVLWWNSHSTDVKKLYGFTIVGDALFRSRLNESTYPTDARKLAEPYETEFVYTSEAAQKLANHLHRFYKYGDIHHRWSEIGVDTPMFQVVTVSAPDTQISSLGMVISQSISFPAPNKIKRSNSAIGITAFNSELVKTRSIQLGGAPVNTGPAGSNGTRSVVQFILGTADGPYTDAGNVVGTDSAVVGTSLALVGVDGAQWAYEAPTPDAGEFVWRREGYYTPPETWPKVWNITRMTGASSFGITLHPSALTVPVSSRGVPYGGDITISAVFQNIPTTYEITWGITGASFVDAGTNQTKVVDVSTITADAVIVTVSVLFGGVTYTDMATLTKVWDGLPAPMKLPMATTETPKNVNGEPLVSGDFFLVGAEFIEGGVTYEVGTLWEYTGTSWVISSDKMKALNAMGDFASIASEAEDGVFCRLIAKEVYAQSAVIEEIGTKEITLKTDGKMQSEVYTPGVTGFQIKADGSADFINASMVFGLFTGTIDSPPLTTTNEGTLGNTITFDSVTHWYVNDAMSVLASQLTPNRWHNISGSHDSVAISKLAVVTIANTAVEVAYNSVSSTARPISFTVTVPYTATLRIRHKSRYYWDDWEYYPEYVTLYRNGVVIYQSSPTYYLAYIDMPLNKGDVITYYGNTSKYISTNKDYEVAWLKLEQIFTTQGLYFVKNNVLGNLPKANYESARLQISSPSFDSDSSTYKKYAKSTAFLAGVSSYSNNVFKTAQGTVIINGTSRTVNGVMKTSTGMMVFHNAGSQALVPVSSDPGTSGYYNMSGSYQVQTTVEGAATMNLNAKTADTYSIGTTVRYLNMAAKTMIAETFDNSSARDKKKDITPFLGSALDILKQVQVVNYRYKTETGEYLHTGFIADDAPDPLTGADHNSMSLGDNIGMLIKAVQELYQLIQGGANA